MLVFSEIVISGKTHTKEVNPQYSKVLNIDENMSKYVLILDVIMCSFKLLILACKP